MTQAERLLFERFSRRAASAEPDVVTHLLDAYRQLRESLSEDVLTRAVREGSVDQLITELLGDATQDRAFSRVRAFIDRQVLDAAAVWFREIPVRAAVGAAFDVLNPRVITAVRQLDTRVIAGLKEEVRETVRQAAQAGLEAGQHPRVVARGIRETLGLAPSQEEAVRNFRRMLEEGDREALTRTLRDRRFDATLRKALGRDGTGLKPEQVERMTEAYRKKMVSFNAETHARTIALDAQRLAQRASWEAAIAAGTVNRDRLSRTWVGVMDKRERPAHVAMEGETVPFDAPFSNSEMIPGSSTFNCRCIERINLAREAA